MTEFANMVFGPLTKPYCDYFYFLSIMGYIFMILSILGLLYVVGAGKKSHNLNFYMASSVTVILSYGIIFYFQKVIKNETSCLFIVLYNLYVIDINYDLYIKLNYFSTSQQ